MTVGELLERLDAEELAEWRAYYELEPFGQDRGDLGPAITSMVLARCHGAADAEVTDFMPKIGDDTTAQPQDWRAMRAAARGFAQRKIAEEAAGMRPRPKRPG